MNWLVGIALFVFGIGTGVLLMLAAMILDAQEVE